MIRPAFRFALPSLLTAACLLTSACQKGPATYHVSGTVTFDGKPVPAGRVDFFPDYTKGGDGVQGFADIKNGRFDTRQDGQGQSGGPMVIRIEGYDGKSDDPRFPGKPIFVVYEIKRDMPKETTVQNLEVPADAAKGLVIKEKPGS